MGTGLSINSEMEPPQAQGKNRGSRIENNVVNSNLEGFFTEHGLKQARKKGREKQLVKICFKSLRGSCCFKILPLCLTSFSTIFINLIFFCPLLLLHSVKKKKKKLNNFFKCSPIKPFISMGSIPPANLQMGLFGSPDHSILRKVSVCRRASPASPALLKRCSQRFKYDFLRKLVEAVCGGGAEHGCRRLFCCISWL